MGDMGDAFKAMNEGSKARRQENLARANSEGWTKHTPYHWSRKLNGKRLDYWPSRNKFQYDGRVMQGGIDGFIRKHENNNH